MLLLRAFIASKASARVTADWAQRTIVSDIEGEAVVAMYDALAGKAFRRAEAEERKKSLAQKAAAAARAAAASAACVNSSSEAEGILNTASLKLGMLLSFTGYFYVQVYRVMCL